jgi:hypothetical protein
MLNSTILAHRLALDLGLTHTPLEVRMCFLLNVVKKITIKTFSNFYPCYFRLLMDTTKEEFRTGRFGYYRIPPTIVDPADIIGIKRVVWEDLGVNSLSMGYVTNYYSTSIIDLQLYNDVVSATRQPITWYMRGANIVELYPKALFEKTNFILELKLRHSKNFFTIETPLEELFYRLALIDVKYAIYNIRKNYRNISTVFGSLEIDLDSYEGMEDKRTELINEMRENYYKHPQRKKIYYH